MSIWVDDLKFRHMFLEAVERPAAPDTRKSRTSATASRRQPAARAIGVLFLHPVMHSPCPSCLRLLYGLNRGLGLAVLSQGSTYARPNGRMQSQARKNQCRRSTCGYESRLLASSPGTGSVPHCRHWQTHQQAMGRFQEGKSSAYNRPITVIRGCASI